MSGRLFRLARDTFFYSAGLVLRRGMAFVTLPVFTRFLAVSDLGVIAVLGTVRELLSVVFELGIPNSSARFYYDCRTEEDRRRLFGTLFLFIMGTSLAGCLLLVLVGPAAWASLAPDIPFHPYVSLTVATVFLSGMGILPRTLFRVTNRVPLYTSLGLVQGVLTAGVSIALVVVFDLGVLGTILGNLVVSLLFFSSFSAI